MKNPTINNRSLARRVALLAVAMLSGVLVTISVVMSLVAEERSRERIVQWVGDKTQSVADSVDAFDATARLMTDRAYRPFRAKFSQFFELDEAAGLIKSWSFRLNGETSDVDDFNKMTGGVATVFMRKGEDFERVTTSLKKEDGERAVGTLLARDHPAYPLVLQGQNYTGRAVLFGKPYMTHYEALKDQAGKVVGILFIGFDLSDFQTALQKLVSEARFFESGSTVIIDPRKSDADAVFVVHPTAAGKKVLEAYPSAGPLLASLRATPEAFVADSTSLVSNDLSSPWVVKRPTKAGGWWVVAEVSDDEAMASHWATMYAFWGLLVAATAVLGLGLYWLVRRNVSRPLGSLTVAVTAVANGDLSQRFTTDRSDEIGRLVREVEDMRQRFVGMLGELRQASDSIGTASAEIASGNQDLSSRTEQAASNLQQTAASMEQLTSTVKNSADAARQANQLAASASEIAVRGGQVVDQVVHTMQEIHRSSQKINDIIGVIDGIAFQTNILALNAAVEAARAGEQGRGFAVVADEVRKLAERTSSATTEIEQMISGIQGDTSSAVDAMNAALPEVDQGVALAASAAEALQAIEAGARQTLSRVREIADATREQSAASTSIAQRVEEISNMVESTSENIRGAADAAVGLERIAVSLKDQIARFRV